MPLREFCPLLRIGRGAKVGEGTTMCARQCMHTNVYTPMYGPMAIIIMRIVRQLGGSYLLLRISLSRRTMLRGDRFKLLGESILIHKVGHTFFRHLWIRWVHLCNKVGNDTYIIYHIHHMRRSKISVCVANRCFWPMVLIHTSISLRTLS